LNSISPFAGPINPSPNPSPAWFYIRYTFLQMPPKRGAQQDNETVLVLQQKISLLEDEMRVLTQGESARSAAAARLLVRILISYILIYE